MSMQDQIIQLILGQGEVAAQQAKERIAQEEIVRRHKDRFRRGTLQALATFGPMLLNFVPGIGPFAAAGVGAATNRGYDYADDAFLDPSQYPDLLMKRR